jgi:hypothetical protein
MSKETPESLLRRAKSLLRAGKRKEAALTAKKVIENHDFQDARAWRMLHTLAGGGRPFDEWQQHIAKTYYPDKAHLTDHPTEKDIFNSPPSQSQSKTAQKKRWRGLPPILAILGLFGCMGLSMYMLVAVGFFDEYDVEIRVYGDGMANVMYSHASANLTTHDVNLPWDLTFSGSPGDEVMVTATSLTDDYDYITCHVYVDGDLWLTSRERYACMVSGTIP